MTLRIFLFITIVLLIYFALHLGLFLLLRKFFRVTRPRNQVILGLGLLLVAFSFICSFIWTIFDSHGFIQVFYFGSAIWLGMLINALILFSLGLIFWKGAKTFGLTLEIKMLGFGLILVTALYSGYGFINAGNLRTTRLSLPIKNLPQAWQGKRIAQISDVHLGIIHQEKMSRKIVSKIKEEQADLIVITGDLFDGTGDDLTRIIRPFRDITVPILYITGNHETYLGVEKAIAAIRETPIRMLRDEITEIGGLQVLGVDFPGRWEKKDLQPLLKRLDRSKPSLLLTHVPSQIEMAKKYGVSLHLCGHTHKGQMWPMPLFTHWVFHGYDYGLHRLGEYTIYTTSGAGTFGPPMRIGSHPEVVVITLL
jgi:uncharacterized protein